MDNFLILFNLSTKMIPSQNKVSVCISRLFVVPNADGSNLKRWSRAVQNQSEGRKWPLDHTFGRHRCSLYFILTCDCPPVKHGGRSVMVWMRN